MVITYYDYIILLYSYTEYNNFINDAFKIMQKKNT